MASFSSHPLSPLILYASETGNAEDVAYSLHSHWNQVFSNWLPPVSFRIYSVEDYDVAHLMDESVVVFVLSTCGDGEFPIPMRKMWNSLLKRNLQPGIFSRLKFSVFGLGDSSYEKFNAAARKLFVRLQQLGAEAMLEYMLGLGDDQAGEGYLAALDPWTKLMTEKFQLLFSSEANVPITREDHLPVQDMTTSLTNYIISYNDVNSSSLTDNHPLQNISESIYNWKVYRTKVTQNDRMTAVDWSQAVHHITFTVEDKDEVLDYRAGDITQIFYSNPVTIVEPIVSYFSTREPRYSSKLLSIEYPTSNNNHLQPSSFRRSRLHSSLQCTLESMFRDVLDIGAIPKRSYFSSLAVWAKDGEEREKLLEISSARGADLYYDYCLRERRNYVEVLLDFPSVDIPLSYFVGLVPLIQPRPYSIASSPRYKLQSLELCVAVVQRITPYKRRRIGLCSGFLAQLPLQETVFLRIQKGSFPHFSSSLSAPGHFPKHMLLIGPGTGVAPMRAMLQDRLLSSSTQDQSSSSTLLSSLPSVDLYFGCRREHCDELYEYEWRSVNNGFNPYVHGSDAMGTNNTPVMANVSAKVHVAHSQNIGQLAKVYVTHLLQQEKEALVRILRDPDTFIGIAGSAKRMPKDVKQAFIKVLTEYGNSELGVEKMTELDAQKLLQLMIREKRLIVEAWG